MWCDLIGSYCILFLNFSNLFVVGTAMPFILTCPCSFSLPFSVGIQGMVVGPCLFVKTSGHDVFVPEAWNMASFGASQKPFRYQKWQLSTLDMWKRSCFFFPKKWDFRWNKRWSTINIRSAISGGLALGGGLGFQVFVVCFFLIILFWNFGNPIW